MTSSLLEILSVLIFIAIVIVSIVFHELSHGYAALYFGDLTAKNAGRLSLNPIRHLDLFGSILLPLMMYFGAGGVFGYAKPIPYNPSCLKNPRRDELLVALAGPISNLIQAFIAALLYQGVRLMYKEALVEPFIAYWLLYIFASACRVNVWLCFFNILPIPPLDGASIIAFFLPRNAMNAFYTLKSYSMLVLIVLVFIIPQITGVDVVGMYFDAVARPLCNSLLR